MSWYDVIWVCWIVAFGVFEAFGVREEGKVRGVEPLTRLIRDRWMRRSKPVWVFVFVFWTWLGLHFFLGVGLPGL